MMKLAISSPVEKIRHKQIVDGFLWEIDVFSGANQGLVLAEIELTSENQKFTMPEWILEEVTNDGRYYNSYLSCSPFSFWNPGMA
jgi:CYTH domain-containing protein